MGFFSNVANRVRDALSRDKDKAVIRLAKASTAPGAPVTGFDLLQAYGYDVVAEYLQLEQDLLSKYVDYEEMDDYPELSAALDIFADDATQMDTQYRRSIWVTSEDQTTKEILDEDLLKRRLRADEEVWEIARELCKYGNDYEELLIDADGVIGLNFLPPPTVRRIEGPRGELFGFVQDFKGRFGYSPAEFQQILAMRSMGMMGDASGSTQMSPGMQDAVALEDWEVVHFRLRGKQRRSVYGHSSLESARWIWKRLMLLEDAAMIYRLQRAPERYAFYVDTGDLPPAEALAYTNRVKQMYKKKKFFDTSTGKMNLKFDPLSQDEDFFVPVRKGVESTRIEVLGSPSWQHMEDIEYFQNKMFAAIKIPKTYLAQDGEAAKAILSSQDVRFARTVLRIQRELRNGFAKICRVHLAALNKDPYAVEYDVQMTVPSAIFELAQLEVRNARADLAGRMKEDVSHYWLLSKIYGMSDEEIEGVLQQMDNDAVKAAEREAKAQAAAAKLQPKAQESEPAVPSAPSAPVVSRPGAPATPVPPSAPPTSTREPDYRKLHEGTRSTRQRAKSRMTEQELFRGSREGERRATEKLDKLLKNDRVMADRMDELGQLLNDLSASSRPLRRK